VDDGPGAHPVVVLSYRYWQSHFAADPNVIGRGLKINGVAFTIIGITRPGFYGTELIMSSDYWVPMSMEAQIEPGNIWLSSRGSQQVWTMGRLKPGVSRAQAENTNPLAKIRIRLLFCLLPRRERGGRRWWRAPHCLPRKRWGFYGKPCLTLIQKRLFSTSAV
jgi:MacB-like periplasmic core domain